jgi:hypothetical protein
MSVRVKIGKSQIEDNYSASPSKADVATVRQSPQVSFHHALHAFEHLDVRCLKADLERLGLCDQRGASTFREEDAPPPF